MDPCERPGQDGRRAESRLEFGRLLCVAALLQCAWATAASGSVTLVHDEEVIVQAHEVIEDDLVVFAPYVRVDGVVKGDLVVLGSEVVVEGIVEQDLLVVSKTLYLDGAVNDDLRAASYAIALGDEARVADDFWSVGYSLETKPGSRIGGSLQSATRQLLLAGQIVESLLVRAGALELQGLVGGNVNAVVGGLEGFTHSNLVVNANVDIPEVADGVTLTGSAAIGGDLDYRSPLPARVAPEARIAGRVHHEPWRGPAPPGSAPGFDGEELLDQSGDEGIERFVVLLLVGWGLALLAPRFLAEQVDRVRDEPLNLLGWGLGAVVFTGLLSLVVGIVFLILMVLGLGTSLGGLAWTAIVAGSLTQLAIGALFFLAAVYLAPALASAGLGGALLARLRRGGVGPAAGPGGGIGAGLAMVALGAAVYGVLRLVPGLGVLIGLAAGLIGLGALAVTLRERFSA